MGPIRPIGLIRPITRAMLYAALFLPLLFTDFTFFPWHFGKTVIFQILVELALAVVAYMTYRSYRTNRTYNWLDIAVFVFLVILTITAITGVNFPNSFWGNEARASGVFTWWHFGIFYFLLINLFKENKDWTRLFFLAAAVGAIAAVTAIFPSILPESWVSASGGGIIGNRAFLAYYLSPLIGLGVYLFFTGQSRWRWIYLGAAILSLYALVLTNNRGAFLGLVVGVLTSLFVAVKILPIRKHKLIAGSAVIAILLCAIGLFFLLRNTSLGERWPRLFNLTRFSISSGTGATRFLAWASAFEGIKERPILGWGMGNYEIIFSKYYSASFLKYGFSETVWDKPHNWLLEIATASGIFGAAGYLSIYAVAFFYLLRRKGNEGEALPASRLILFSVLTAYFVQSLFLFETTNTLLVWFLILAFISAKQSAAPQPMENKKQFFRRAFAVVAAILVAFSLYRFNFVPLRASYYLRQAEKSANLNDWTLNANKALDQSQPAWPAFEGEIAVFLSGQFVQFDKRGDLTSNESITQTVLNVVRVLRQEENKHPDNLSYPTWAGQVLMTLGARADAAYYAEAKEEFKKAIQISPKKQESWFLLGRLLLLEKNFPEALSAHARAVDIDPSVSASHWFFGLAKVASGDLSGGLFEIEKARELGYNLDREQKLYVLDLYASDKNYKKLVEEYGKLVSAEPDNVIWYVRLATAYALSGDKAAALKVAKILINSFPEIKADAEKFIKDYKLE